MIPKIIHYCWLGDDPFPPKIQFCINSWKKYLPEYEFVLWDKNKFDINSCLWVKQAYDAKKYAFAADYIRLYALYHYGGIYLDSDVEVLKSFNPLLTQSYILGVEDVVNVRIEAATIGAQPHNEYIKKCLDYYDGREFIVEGKMDEEPLPFIMIRLAEKYRILSHEKEYSQNEDSVLQIYTKEFFSPKSNVGILSHATPKTYSIHHFAGSWIDPKIKFSMTLSKYLGKKLVSYLCMVRCVLKKKWNI